MRIVRILVRVLGTLRCIQIERLASTSIIEAIGTYNRIPREGNGGGILGIFARDEQDSGTLGTIAGDIALCLRAGFQHRRRVWQRLLTGEP